IPTLKKYHEQYPNVGIILKQMSNTEQINALNENKIDIALVSAPISNENIQVQAVKKMDFVAALPEKHPLAEKPSLSFKDLAAETFIMTPKSAGSLYYETVLDAFKNTGVTPKTTIQAHDLQTVLVLVAS